MRLRVQEILQGPVLSVLRSSVTPLPSVVLVDVSTDGSNISLRAPTINQPTTGTYAQSLSLASKIIASANLSRVPALCELDSILFISDLESDSAGVYLVEMKDFTSPVVLKILTETDFLLNTDEELFPFGARLAAMYREIHILMTIPSHPNIVGPPVALVTIPYVNSPATCGFLSPFHPGGTIACALNPLSPDTELPSCTANSMGQSDDIKLDNVVLSSDDDAVFIDFEQGRHAEECLAPEAHGSWDVISNNIPATGSDIDAPAPATIRYVRYTGSERDDAWSAYEAWAKYPEVIEAIEVYSLGDSLQTLFEGTVPPSTIGSIVAQSLLEDPMARPRLDLIRTALKHCN